VLISTRFFVPAIRIPIAQRRSFRSPLAHAEWFVPAPDEPDSPQRRVARWSSVTM